MAFARPSLETLRTQVRNRLTSALAAAGQNADAAIPRSLLRVFAEVVAGGMHILYGALEWVSRQILPDTADDEFLVRHASLYAIERQPAGKWAGVLTFTGTNTTLIPTGTTITRADGAVYVTTADGTISGGAVDIAAEAEIAGASGGLEDGQELTLGSPIVGIDPEVTVDTTTTTATDEETIAELRERVLQRIRETPQGGSADDYERWAREVTGVTRARAVPLARGAGTVDVYFMVDDGGDGIPSGGEVTTVQEYIDARRPVTADVDVLAPTTTAVNVALASLEPDNVDTRAAAEAALDELFAAKALASNADGTPATIYVSDFWQAITSATGITAVDVTTPSADMTPAEGEVFVLGSLT